MKRLMMAAVLISTGPAMSFAAQAAPVMDFDRGFIRAAMINVQPGFQIPEPAQAEYAEEANCPCPGNGKGKTKLETIEGIGPVYAGTLRDNAGLITLDDLLDAGAARKGRKALEKATGIGHKLILEWVNLADLMRIKGIGEEYSDLLEEAGVDTVKELRRRVPENLHRKIAEVNGAKRLVRRVPSISQVEDWVLQAKSLQPLVTY